MLGRSANIHLEAGNPIYFCRMTISEKRADSIAFVIAPPFIRRIIALAGALLFLLYACWIPTKVGFNRFAHVFMGSWVGWLVYAMMLIPASLFLWLAFPSRSAMDRLQISHDGISFVPGTRIKSYFAQPVIEAAITPQATEILLCQHGLSKGFRIIIRSADKTEREIDPGASLTLHSAEEGQEIANGIAAVTGLPVRLVIRRRLADKTIDEKPWQPSVSRGNLRIGLVLATGTLPWLGGIAAGFTLTRPAFIVGVGLALWLVWRLALFVIKHDKPRWSSTTAMYAVVNLFMFGVAYGLAVILTVFVFRAH
jgi:hypothetical protein